MDPIPPGLFRIYRADPVEDGPAADAYRLASRELLRPPAVRPPHRELEPYSRSWFEELEVKRYAPHGGWLRRVLEFTRHAGESLLMIGAGVGSDALQYHRHGTDVTICATPADHPDLVRKNFELRGLAVRMVFAGADLALPFQRGTFDLAYLNLIHDPPTDPVRLAVELYRVLKPGGKAFVLAPARYDLGFWQGVLLPFRRWYRSPVEWTAAPRYSARSLKRLFAPFAEHRVAKRHLRRSELPHLWRFAPISLAERVIGRVLILRAFKPVSAAMEAGAVEGAA